uniref:Putative reverse transcriptase domain-containing protein n=1 Tax=Tanacetum cinerariifolium TaxID=118510 RepID=A0A6L2N7B2_TANCI|nr:putative reverse transcriptase domain-containing protein [Tanacetum cinerariifolium]
MPYAEIDQIVAQRVTDAIEAIAVYEAKIRMAHDSMNLVVRQGTTVEKNDNNTRKFENQPKDNRVPQQPPFKKLDVARAYTIRANEKKAYAKDLPYCNKCKLHHVGPCIVKCSNCKRVGHMTRDCKASVATMNQRAHVANPKATITCYECERLGYFRDECQKLINQDQVNQTWKEKAPRNSSETEDKSDEKRLKDVPTVRDFLDVFLEDFPGLPPMRQVEFQIDLVPSAAPMAQVLYRLAPAYHPQTDGQSERTIQTLEDMLRAWAIDFGKGWDRHLPLVEFSYNNSYHTSIKVAPFEALYGRKSRSRVYWLRLEALSSLVRKLFMKQLRRSFRSRSVFKLHETKRRATPIGDRKKSYVDRRRKPLEFKVGDKVMLKVSP